MPDPEHSAELSAADAKLVTLARAARARIGSAEGAAVRDDTGRSYAAASVALPSLQLSALQAAVAAAVAAGASTLEAAVVVSATVELDQPGSLAVRDLNPAASIYLAAPDGTLVGP
jgi:hypothetical protein